MDLARQLTAAEAEQVGLGEVERLGLTSDYSVARRDGASVTLCRLFDGSREVMMGLGRGEGADARVGALFEALERNAFRLVAAEGLSRISDIAGQPVLPATDVVHRIARSHPTAVVEAWTYSGPTALLYPSLLTNPFLGSEEARRTEFGAQYLRYSSGVGSAAGAKEDEAATHGLLELVEHDAMGLAMLRWFVAGEEPLAVAMEGMSEDLSARVRAVEHQTGRSLDLVDITTDIGIPCFLAVHRAAPGDVPIVGSAASLDPLDAAMRAIGEVEQMWVLHRGWPDADKSLTTWPVLERCRRFAPWNPRAEHEPDWGQQLPIQASLLSTVEDCLRKTGFTSYRKVLTPSESRISVVSCLVPGLERFGLVRYGHPIVPTGRGREIWEDALGLR